MLCRRKNQGFLRKKQGLDGKPVKREKPQNSRRRDKDNIANKIVLSPKYIYIYIYTTSDQRKMSHLPNVLGGGGGLLPLCWDHLKMISI